MDGLCIKSGIVGMAPPIPSASFDVRANPSQICALGRSSMELSAVAPPQKAASASRFSFKYPLRSLWRGGSDRRGGDSVDAGEETEIGGGGDTTGSSSPSSPAEEEAESSSEAENGNWVLKILRVNSMWKGKQGNTAEDTAAAEEEGGDRRDECGGGGDGGEEGCYVCRVDDEEEMEFDRESFSRLLRRVSLKEAKLYAQMSYLGNLAYSIPNIKPVNLLKYRGLHFVTSSMENKDLAANADESSYGQPENDSAKGDKDQNKEDDDNAEKGKGYQIRASAVYQIAASAASYLHLQTKSILPFSSSKSDTSDDLSIGGMDRIMNSEMVSLKATTDSVTAVVAAKEEEKQAVANSLNSARSTPCDWFICDDDRSSTRFFVIQGSESLESWQANLLFEPVQFEGLDVLVHRGIYEAAKGIYEQMLPEVRNHLKSSGSSAALRFTGHSLGGSLSLLINLMLLIRGEVPRSSLLPVMTFGAPCIMCGGDHLLRKLGLPRSHVQSVTLHRDIVPRAFSCNYPNHVAELLKAVNGNFRNHPCLDKQKLLYAPMGDLLILQPDETMSPCHHLLPSGSGLFLLTSPSPDSPDAQNHLHAAKMVFINSPHPLEILSDRSAYGAAGSIHRDHDMNSYLKSVRHIVRQEVRRVRKAEREAERDRRQRAWWNLVDPRGIGIGERFSSVIEVRGRRIDLYGIVKTGRETARRFGRLVASQHMHLVVVLFFPVRLLLVGAYNVINFR